MRRSPSPRAAVAGAIALVAIAFALYSPGLRMGFYLDDYNYLERAGRTDWSNALAQIFDPRVQTMWYRPLQAIQFFVEYQIFGGNSNAYHLVNMGLHAVNVLLLYALAWKISKRWLIGLVSAFLYSTFSVYASGINWVGIVDPLTAVFYLLSIWFWWAYLESGDKRRYALTLAAFVLALLSKQVAITIPVVLFLAEWWLLGRPVAILPTLRRYGLFAVPAALFLLIQYTTQSTHTFAGVFGWQVGATMAFIFIQYLVLVFFPWGVYPSLDINQVEAGGPVTYLWVAIALLLFAYTLVRTRSRVLLFLGAFTLLNLIPVLPFPFIEHRYLYIPILAAAVLLALVFNLVRARFGYGRGLAIAGSAAIALLLVASGLAVDESVTSAAEWARQLRVPFRDIERQHATFPRDTLLYFVDPITPTTGGLSGMFFLRYGRDITVKNWSESADFASHNAAYVYYFDDQRRPREIQVDKAANTRADVRLPADYQVPIRLEGYEIARSTVKRGEPLLLILNWRSLGPVDRPYTVFVHLVDAGGKQVAGYDAEPHKAQTPTNSWLTGALMPDPILLPIGPEVPLGSGYKLQVGLYDIKTMERVPVLDTDGRPGMQSITIEPFSVIE